MENESGGITIKAIDRNQLGMGIEVGGQLIIGSATGLYITRLRWWHRLQGRKSSQGIGVGKPPAPWWRRLFTHK
jgi:hypothetical protein